MENRRAFEFVIIPILLSEENGKNTGEQLHSPVYDTPDQFNLTTVRAH
jgi:hypothetical protein